jgi:heat shock protein HslJ
MRRRSTILASVGIAVLSLVVVVGCSGGGSSLEGTQWKLTGWTLSSLDPANFTITAQFADGTISGSSGVNTYNGEVKVGPGEAFSVGTIATTLMAGPEDAMRAETAYTTLLNQAKSFKMAAGNLTLYDVSGNESLIFEAASK